MKCPECGQWNRASMPHCTRCGTPLNIDESSRIAWKDSLRDGGASASYLRADEFGQTDETPDGRDVLAKEMQDLKTRKSRGSELLEQMRDHAAGQTDNAVTVMEGRSDSPARSFTLLRRSESNTAEQRESETRHRVRFMDDTGSFIESRTYDPLVPDYPGDRHRNDTPYASVDPYLRNASRDRREITRRLLTVAAIVLIAVGGGLLAWNLTLRDTPAGESIRQFFSGSAAPKSNAVIEASMLNDLKAHTIQIPGEEGTTIYIKELHGSYTVIDGYATVEIPDHTWYDNLEGSLSETMEVTLTPFLKTSSGRQTPLEPITYTIDIPLSPIELDTPDTLRATVSTVMSTIKIFVRPGSRVTINGEDYSDTVNSKTGEMSYNAEVHPIGDNHYVVTVRSQYCRENTIDIVFYREPQEIPLDLAAGTYSTTNQKIMKVSATTLAGAYVEVTTPHTDLDITRLASEGKFSFYAEFDHIGNNTITIIASYPGKKTSQVDHIVYYCPEEGEYSKKAWAMDATNYGELLSNISVRAERNQVYVIKGVVQYIFSDKPQIVVINSSDDGKSQPVFVENKTKTKWEVGKYYRIFADAYSTYNNMPWLIARYTYEH